MVEVRNWQAETRRFNSEYTYTYIYQYYNDDSMTLYVCIHPQNVKLPKVKTMELE